ncbi:MAG: superoxide dismutase family protein [Oscillospiraceae bacterium]|nr:superoxide dismutase family protein [Oscillospiraceae bacterium]
MHCFNFNDIVNILNRRPDAYALVTGDEAHANAMGRVNFYSSRHGVLVAAKIMGLPESDDMCSSRIFAFHIHEGGECSGNQTDPFANALTHYNPEGCRHPHHAGDLPPLFSNCGLAVSVFLTNRFMIEEIIGKTVIVHDGVDDFTSQPSGNAGSKIMCGIIKSSGSRSC